MNKRIVFFTSHTYLAGVFDSTVLEVLRALKNQNEKLDLSLICFTKQNLTFEEKSIFINKELEVLKLVNKTDLLYINERGLKNLPQQIDSINQFITHYQEEDLVLICQNYYASYIGSCIKKKHPQIHFHVSLKGVVPEEHLLYGKKNKVTNTLIFLITKFFEHRFIKRGDSFSAVSNQFRKYINAKYAINKNFIVYPSAFNHEIFYYDETLREKTRAKLKIHKNEVLLTYSGSFQKWQNPNTLFRLFTHVLNNYSHYKILIITYDQEKARSLIQHYQIPENRVILKTGMPVEVNAWLNASDICTLLRKNDIVNRVASPTKFLEYVVTKNKIFMTDHIGDYSEMIKNTNFGLVAPDLELETLVNLFAHIDQVEYPSEAFIQEINKIYSIDSNIKKLIDCI